MFQKRSLTTGFLVASLGIAAGFAVLSSSDVASAGAPCGGSAKTAAVKAACDKNGRDEAKKVMKDAMDKANGKGAKGKDGKKLECKSCHKDTNATFELNDDAAELSKQLELK